MLHSEQKCALALRRPLFGIISNTKFQYQLVNCLLYLLYRDNLSIKDLCYEPVNMHFICVLISNGIYCRGTVPRLTCVRCQQRAQLDLSSSQLIFRLVEAPRAQRFPSWSANALYDMSAQCAHLQTQL